MGRTRFAAGLGFIVCSGAALIAAALLTAPAQGGRPHENPAAFARHIVELIADNRYAAAWASLHPDHQRVAPRSVYVSCELQSPIPGHLDSVNVVRVYDAPAGLGGGRFVSSKAVVVRIEISAGAASSAPPVVVNDTVHAVPVNGRWRWILPTQRLEEYRTGHCPDGAPLQSPQA